MRTFPFILLLVSLQIPLAGCTDPPAGGNLPHYDLSQPAAFMMPPELDEISGIALARGRADTIFAEQDEEGKLFYFHLGDAVTRHTRFAKKGDYEDLAICHDRVIMLRSDGVFFTFPLNSIAGKDAADVKEQDGLLPPGEYESLYADESSNTLYALCKNCSGDKQGSVNGYAFTLDAAGGLSAKNQFSIDEKAIAALTGKQKFRLKPSALAKNPLTHQWYIISSVNKILITANEEWKPVGLYTLNPALFTQPEGIAFDAAGNLYISNEKGAAAQGSILRFRYQKK